MSILKYFAEAEINKEDLKNKLVELFIKEKPSDSVVHKFAEDNSIDSHSLEDIIYEILYDIFHGGKSKGQDNGYDPEQIKMGMEVEKEHTSIPALARKISYDHLSEIPNYYTLLDKMESSAKGVKESILDDIAKY